MPFSDHRSMFRAESRDLNFGEGEPAHLLLGGVTAAVVLEHLPVTPRDRRTHEGCRVAGFVARHEALDIAAVPGGLLRFEYATDVAFDGLLPAGDAGNGKTRQGDGREDRCVRGESMKAAATAQVHPPRVVRRRRKRPMQSR